jgi:hypothetical protein
MKNEQRHERFCSFNAGASGDTGIISDVGIDISSVVGDDIIVAISECIGYMLFKTGSLAKSLFSAR